MEGRIYAIATMDTKGQELAFLAERLRTAGVDVVTVDVGTGSSPTAEPDVDRATVASHHPDASSGKPLSGEKDRGQAVTAMSQALERYLLAESKAGRVGG